MDAVIDAVFGWGTIALVLALPIALIVTGVAHAASRRPIEERYRGAGGGLVGVFDSVWSPSAHEAGMERDRETRRSIPAPTPDPDWVMRRGADGTPTRIRIDVAPDR
ncbi:MULTISPECIES: hypothetical protein [unclassified Microbacterium]|uniref:hypothetical protein n=1 Tax=unclassified Microbacterium TaxID=2609290 RepID=UPI0022F064B4|nr:hypothetical protein [Streptomyces sp. MS2A]